MPQEPPPAPDLPSRRTSGRDSRSSAAGRSRGNAVSAAPSSFAETADEP